MVSISRSFPSIQGAAIVNDTSSAHENSVSVQTAPSTINKGASSPGKNPILPKSMTLNGKNCPVGSLKGRKTSEQKAYLTAALSIVDKASITQHADNRFTYDAKVLVNPDVGQESFSVEIALNAAGQMSSVTLKNSNAKKEPLYAEFDNVTKNSIAEASLLLNEAKPDIPAKAVFDGTSLPWHPDGERYKAFPYIQGSGKPPLVLTGIPHADGHKFDVYDIKNDEFLLQLPMEQSRKNAPGVEKKNTLISSSDARLPGGMRHIKRTAPGVKSSRSSPTGYKKDGEPCDRHGKPVAGSSSAQASSSSSNQPLRSALGKTVENNMKQYWLDGRPIGPSYAVKQPYAPENERAAISQKYASSIYQRGNPASPYVKKIKTDIHAAPETQQKIEVRNKIAGLVAGNRRAKHFAVEMFSGEKNGEPGYIARRINGFSLDNFSAFNASKQAGEIDDNSLKSMFNELSEAVNWLNRSGYFHNDIQLGNIMYDRDNNSLVLIDFELANRTELYGRSQERSQIEAIRNNL